MKQDEKSRDGGREEGNETSWLRWDEEHANRITEGASLIITGPKSRCV